MYIYFFSAKIWAEACGREDLLEKSLNNITKYFLCSEHFETDSFLDPPNNTKLRKTLRPPSYPIPTKFRCNFDQYCPQLSAPDSDASLLYLTDETSTNEPAQFLSSSPAPPSDISRDGSIPKDIETNSYQVEVLEDDKCLYINKGDSSFDDIEAYCLIDPMTVTSVYDKDNDRRFVIGRDEPTSYVDEQDDFQIIEEVEDEEEEIDLDESRAVDYVCRLCTNQYKPPSSLFQIFDNDNDYLKENIERLLPNAVSFILFYFVLICFFY